MLNWSSLKDLPVYNLITQAVVILLVSMIISYGQLNLIQVTLIAILSVIIFAMLDYLKIYYGQTDPAKPSLSINRDQPTYLNNLWVTPTPKATKAGLRTTQPIRPLPSSYIPRAKRVKFNHKVQTVNQWGHFSDEALRGHTCLDD
jgi:hypothetical protein